MEKETENQRIDLPLTIIKTKFINAKGLRVILMQNLQDTKIDLYSSGVVARKNKMRIDVECDTELAIIKITTTTIFQSILKSISGFFFLVLAASIFNGVLIAAIPALVLGVIFLLLGSKSSDIHKPLAIEIYKIINDFMHPDNNTDNLKTENHE